MASVGTAVPCRGVNRPPAPTTAGRLLLAAVLVLTACVPFGGAAEPTPSGPTIRIGVGPEAESLLLSTVLRELLAAEGFVPQLVERADGQAARQALEVGDVDVLPGYTGQTWLEVLGLPNPPGDPRTSFARVAAVDASNGIEWIRPAFDLEAGVEGPPADATFGLFIRGFPSLDADVYSITQLASRLAERPDARVCVDPDFAVRPDGWEALATSGYSIAIADRVLTAMGPTEAVRAVASGQCFVGLGSATDGEAWAAGLRLLADPLEVFPAFVVAAQVREDVLADHPAVADALAPFAEELTTALLGTWNGWVAQDIPVEEVAARAAQTLRQRSGVVPEPSEAAE